MITEVGVEAAGTRVGVGTAAKPGTAARGGKMVAQAGTITVNISAGTSTAGAVLDGADPLPPLTAGMVGAGRGLSAAAEAGRLALRLGVERFRLGMAPRLVGPGQFVGRCVDRH